MNNKLNFSSYTLLVSLVLVGLLAAACSPSKPAPTPIVIAPTAIPTKPLPTTEPRLPTPTTAPKIAPTTAPTTTPAAKILPFGQAQIMGQVSILPSRYELLPESGSDKPNKGDQFLVVTFSIDNTSKTNNYDFNPADLVVLSPTGTVLSMVTLKSLTNELTTQTLKPGAKLNGVIAYQLPQTEDKWTLELKGTQNQNLMWSNAG